jgi:hypothetical protein
MSFRHMADQEVASYLGHLAPRMRIEDYNRAAIILDLDGNGWSDRFDAWFVLNLALVRWCFHSSHLCGFVLKGTSTMVQSIQA